MIPSAICFGTGATIDAVEEGELGTPKRVI